MKPKNLFLLIAFACLFCMNATGQQTILRNFSAEEYKGGTQNWQVMGDNNDCIYFANNYGLLIFDGFRWTVNQVRNYTAVRSMFIDSKERRIYVGASDEFGYFQFNEMTNKTEYKSLSELLMPEERNFTEIWRVHRWNDRHVFQGHYSIYVVDARQNMQIMHQRHRIETSSVIDGKLYVVSREDMRIIAPDGRSQTVSMPTEIRQNAIREIVKVGRDMIICTAGKGLFKFDGVKFTHYDTTIDNYLYDARIFSVAVKNGRLAIGTVTNGLFVYDIAEKTARHINVQSGLQNNTVLSIMFDRSNNLWLGLDNGIAFVEQHSAYYKLLNTSESIGTGYASLISGGRLYLGTNQGLFSMSVTGDNMPFGTPTPVSGIKGQVWELTSSDGTMLCGNDDGVFAISGNKAEKISGSDGTWCICRLTKHPGHMIASDYKGLYVLAKKGNGYVVKNRLSNSNIISNNIIEDPDGSIWVCHWQKGIYHIWVNPDLTKITRMQLFNSKNGLYVDQGNDISKIGDRIYISSVDGFYRYDNKTNKLKKDEAITLLFNTYDTALKLHSTAGGDIWGVKPGFLAIARRNRQNGNRGGYSLDRTSFQSISNKLQIGLGRISNMNDRFTLFNSNDGFYVLDNFYHNSHEKGKVYIRRIVGINRSDTTLYSHFSSSASDIVIPHSQNTIRIEYVMPEYRMAEGITYSCYMENYDKNWSAQQSACYKEYTHLAKGKYTFHVKAYNNINGATDEAVLSFEILPAWYETIYAYIVYWLLVALAFYGVFLLLRRRSMRQLKLQKQMQEKEMAELKSKHLETELHHKSNELASSTMSLVHKNDILQDIDSQMGKLSESVRREEPKKELTKRITDIRKGIQESLNDENNWEKFEESFDLIYNNLIIRLTTNYPELKVIDRKLCAYLRMGLSTKEIASLLNTTTRSVETARYRLRKKLSIPQGQNLTEFIQNY